MRFHIAMEMLSFVLIFTELLQNRRCAEDAIIFNAIKAKIEAEGSVDILLLRDEISTK